MEPGAGGGTLLEASAEAGVPVLGAMTVWGWGLLDPLPWLAPSQPEHPSRKTGKNKRKAERENPKTMK